MPNIAGNPPIQFVASAVVGAYANTVTIPSYLVGDMLLTWCGTPMTGDVGTPDGTGWNVIGSGSCKAAWKIAANTSQTTITWSGASEASIFAYVIRNAVGVGNNSLSGTGYWVSPRAGSPGSAGVIGLTSFQNPKQPKYVLTCMSGRSWGATSLAWAGAPSGYGGTIVDTASTPAGYVQGRGVFGTVAASSLADFTIGTLTGSDDSQYRTGSVEII